MNPTPDMLSRLPLFSGLNAAELDMLSAELHLREVGASKVVCTQGDRADSAYVVVSGRLGVYKESISHRLAWLESGDVFGHIALIDGGVRSATCQAEEASTLLQITGDVFKRLFAADNGFAYKVLDRVALDVVARLREVTDRLGKVVSGRLNPDEADARVAEQVAAASLLLTTIEFGPAE